MIIKVGSPPPLLPSLLRRWFDGCAAAKKFPLRWNDLIYPQGQYRAESLISHLQSFLCAKNIDSMIYRANILKVQNLPDSGFLPWYHAKYPNNQDWNLTENIENLAKP